MGCEEETSKHGETGTVKCERIEETVEVMTGQLQDVDHVNNGACVGVLLDATHTGAFDSRKDYGYDAAAVSCLALESRIVPPVPAENADPSPDFEAPVQRSAVIDVSCPCGRRAP